MSTEQKSLARIAAQSSDLRVRQVLNTALKLMQEGVGFRMGGKSPEEGFDASGFVSYLLAEAGALDPQYHRTFSVARLSKSLAKVDEAAAKPGDLVFLDGSFVAFHLGPNLALGIGGSKGIHELMFFPKAKKSFRRWAYEQDIRLLK